MGNTRANRKNVSIAFVNYEAFISFEELSQIFDPEETLATATCEEWNKFYEIESSLIEKYVRRKLIGFEKEMFEEKLRNNSVLRMTVRNMIKSLEDEMVTLLAQDEHNDDVVINDGSGNGGKLVEMLPPDN
ncbi:MAG: hypothetical protein AAFN93_23710 [Bacteroidota bacterium]